MRTIAERFTRRDFLGTVGKATILSVTTSQFARSQVNEVIGKPLPNIVYILADDMGYGDVGCLNPDGKIPTPNMDRLRREGMAFTDAHSGSAVCTPTRYGILTGRYCWRSSLKKGVLEGYSPSLIPPERLTVASLLKQHGYRTACIGKWHLGLDWASLEGERVRPQTVDYSKPFRNGPTSLGFDYFFGIPASLDMVPYVYLENDRVVEPPSDNIVDSPKPAFFRGGPIAPGFKHIEVLPALTGKAEALIDGHAREHKDTPLFLYLPLPAPHTPILPTGEFQGKSGLGAYGDFVCEVDHCIGRVLDALARNGLSENTLVILTSDNGFAPMADFESLQAQGHFPSYKFRGYKSDIFEGGHRIPFIARWPGHVPAGATSTRLTCLTDLMATLADILGTSLPDNAGEDSSTLLPALSGNDIPPEREGIVHHSVNGSFSIRSGRWKLEFCADSGGWSPPKIKEAAATGLPSLQLYDLENDLGEKNNVQEQHPEVVARLTALMEKYIEEGRSTPGSPQKNEGKIVLQTTG